MPLLPAHRDSYQEHRYEFETLPRFIHQQIAVAGPAQEAFVFIRPMRFMRLVFNSAV